MVKVRTDSGNGLLLGFTTDPDTGDDLAVVCLEGSETKSPWFQRLHTFPATQVTAINSTRVPVDEWDYNTPNR
mgnify:CR=1 FL=1